MPLLESMLLSLLPTSVEIGPIILYYIILLYYYIIYNIYIYIYIYIGKAI